MRSNRCLPEGRGQGLGEKGEGECSQEYCEKFAGRRMITRLMRWSRCKIYKRWVTVVYIWNQYHVGNLLSLRKGEEEKLEEEICQRLPFTSTLAVQGRFGPSGLAPTALSRPHPTEPLCCSHTETLPPRALRDLWRVHASRMCFLSLEVPRAFIQHNSFNFQTPHNNLWTARSLRNHITLPSN